MLFILDDWGVSPQDWGVSPAFPDKKISCSGHETFVCRYAWLPKAVKAVKADPRVFKDENSAMVTLGVGKNMVRSIRHWSEAAQIVEPCSEGWRTTDFGERLLGHEANDPFLERPETLWLMHWKLATNPNQKLFTWQQMLNYWHRADFTQSAALAFLQNSSLPGVKLPSERTLSDGVKVFINSYVPTRGRKGEVAEDNLDCPLVELDLLRETKAPVESIYTFNLEDKTSISPSLFAFCLNDFWNNEHPEADHLDFAQISTGEGSPGQVFKLPELAVRSRLEQLSEETAGRVEYVESSSLQQVIRKEKSSIERELLDSIYL